LGFGGADIAEIAVMVVTGGLTTALAAISATMAGVHYCYQP
jgi:hypothetical protein